MKRINKLWLLSAIFLFTVFHSSVDVQASEVDNILFISSYNPNFITFNNQINGIKEVLNKNVQLQIEYMDGETFKTKENEDNFYNLLKYKISNYNDYDGIILADDEALKFAIKYRDELFKDIPMAFLGAQDLESVNEALNLDMVSGVSEGESMFDNISLVMNLHPKAKNIYFINQSYPINEDNEKYIEYIKSKDRDLNIKNIITGDLSIEEIKDNIINIGEDDVILYLYANKSKDGYYMKNSEFIKFIDETIGVPIYHVVDLDGEENCLGGKVISHFDQGKYAAEILLKMLNGDDPKKLFIDGVELNKYKFNYEKMKEHGIREGNLPKGSIIVNKPIKFFQKYKMVIVPGLIVIMLLLVIIIMLIIHTGNKNKYEKELLRAKEKAEYANIAKSSFISNINHELRTPVSVIMSANQLINLKLEKFNVLTKEEFKDKSKIISQNCFRLLRLINNIIDITKADSGFNELMLKNLNIVSLLEQIVTSVLSYTDIKGLNIIFDTTHEDINIAVDPYKIERIVLNLLSNAIKFSSENGIINVNVFIEEENVVFIIKDNGIGIKEEYLTEIFTKFTQIDSTLKRSNEGSGIGLSIVKSFVDMHNGEIEVESKVNEGSSFIVKLPIRVINVEDEYEVKNIDEASTILSAQVELSDIYF